MRIAFVTDVHLDATPAGWQQQPRWCDGIPQLLDALADRVKTLRVDMVIYGGDLVERGTPDAIDRAVARLRHINTPAIVCLGNHDLTEAVSFPYWRRALWNWPQAVLADRCLEFADCDVIALNDSWRTAERLGLFWDGDYPVPGLQPEQLAQLNLWLGRRPEKPAILAVHAPLEAIPPELTGQLEPMEPPPADYTQPLCQVMDRHPRLRLVLAGHCHVTCATRAARPIQRIHLTSTSLSEVPYEFQTVDVNNGALSVRTEALALCQEGPVANPARTWVTGRPADRRIEIPSL